MIAHLYGGTKRAVLAALGSLRSQSLVTGKSEKIRLDPRARPDDGSTALERAILGEAFLSTRYSQLLYAGPIRWATIQMDKELVDRGLLLTQRQRAMMSRCESTLGMGLRVGDHVVDQQVTQPVPSRRRWTAAPTRRTRAPRAVASAAMELTDNTHGGAVRRALRVGCARDH